MKVRNIPIITGLVCTSIMLNMINPPVPIRAGLSSAIDNEWTDHAGERLCWTGSNSNLGYKPVLDECPDIEGTENFHDNFLYKEWCEKTFKNGNYIYEGYKDIAFNIKYTPEAAKADIWQTPFETTRMEKGDCEDAVFLFFSHLSANQENAEIVWGWVIDRQIGVAKAHVWYQLKDKEGRQYVVEGFSNDWNGIIPMDIVENTETRKPILTITHLEASRLSGLISRPDSWVTYQELADLHRSTDFVKYETDDKNIFQDAYTRYHLDAKRIGQQSMSREYKMSWKHSVKHRINTVVSKEISKIFKKLHELFTKYERQRESDTEDLQVAYRSINNIYANRNLNCRR